MDRLKEEVNVASEIKFISSNTDVPLNIFLTNGTRLDCEIIGYDSVSITTTQKGNRHKPQLIYKHAIATICVK